MVRVLILAPFRYVFGSKSCWYKTGESFYLNPQESEGQLELKHLLSPASEYRQWVHVDLAQVDSNLLLEIQQDQQGQIVPDNVGKEISPLPVPETDLTAPAQEPAENPFLQPEIHAVMGDESPKEAEVISEVSEEVVELTPEQKKALRQDELEDLHWKKVERLAESLGIEYTTKAQAITDILAKEFE